MAQRMELGCYTALWPSPPLAFISLSPRLQGAYRPASNNPASVQARRPAFPGRLMRVAFDLPRGILDALCAIEIFATKDDEHIFSSAFMPAFNQQSIGSP